MHSPGSSVAHRFEGAESPEPLRWPPEELDREPFVVVACPIRNRAWMVERHINGLLSQSGPPRRLLYVTGDNADDTEERLRDPAVGFCGPGEVEVLRYDTGCPAWHRSGEPRYSLNDHANLARVYNYCIDKALELWPGATHVWMIDSDIVPEPDVLELLIDANVDAVAPIVPLGKAAWNFMLGYQFRVPQRDGSEAGRLLWDRPFPAPFVCASVLYRREVLDYVDEDSAAFDEERALVRFAPHPRSHDFPMQAALRAAGFQAWVEPRARCSHYMEEGKEPLR